MNCAQQAHLEKPVRHTWLIVAVIFLASCSTTPVPRVTITPTANQTNTVDVRPVSTIVPTASHTPAPPQGAISLEPISPSQTAISLPVHKQLAVVVRENTDEYVGHYAAGLLDPDTERFVQFEQFKTSHVPFSIEWNPDGTQFIYNDWDIGPDSRSATVYRADGSKSFHPGIYAHWTQDGRYLGAWICVGSPSNPYSAYAGYDAKSWTKVCQLCEMSGFNGCYRCDYVCSEPASIEGVSRAWRQAQASESPTPHRYQTLIESDWLRIIDTQTGNEKTYVMPGYRFKIVAWSPDS